MSGPNGPDGPLRSSAPAAAPTLHELLGLPPVPQRPTTAFDPERATVERLESLYRSEALDVTPTETRAHASSLAAPATQTGPIPDRPRAPANHGVRTSAPGRTLAASKTPPEPSASGLAERGRGVTKTLTELVDTAREAPVTTGAVIAGTVAFFAAPLWIPAMAGVVAAVGTGLVLLSVGQVAYYETRAILTDRPSERTSALEESGAAALGVIAGLPAAKGIRIAR